MSDEPSPLFDLPPGVEPENGPLFLHHMMRGGIVPTAEAAARVAELLCLIHEGAEETGRQKPFVAEDKGSYWRVEGAPRREGAIKELGSWHLSIEKHTGRVTDIGFTSTTTWPTVEEALAFLRAHAEGTPKKT